jgi:CubicO group peptidase (beta-lactamase class C family)
MRRFALFGLILIAISCAKARVDLPVDHIGRIEQHLIAPEYLKAVPSDHASLQERMAFYHVPGVSIAVIDHGKVEWAHGYGIADLTTGSTVDEHTLFHGASLSKPINAITVLKFVQDGKLDLDRDINEQMTGWRLPPSKYTVDKPITLRRLLSHTAGMSLAAFGLGYPAGTTLPSVLDVLNGKPPATQPVQVEEQPGKRFHYSGGAVAISQWMVEQITKEPYPRVVKESIFRPLGMKETTFEQTLSAEQLQHVAPGFKGGRRINGPERIYPAMSAAGLWTTASDYCKVVLEIQHAAAGAPAKVLSPGAADAMLTPYILNGKGPSLRKSTVGLGVFLSGQGKGRTFFHAGSHAGYSCYMVGRLEAGQGVVVLTNGDNAFDLIGEIVQTVSEEYGWPDYQFIAPPRPKPATQPTTQSTTRAMTTKLAN